MALNYNKMLTNQVIASSADTGLIQIDLDSSTEGSLSFWWKVLQIQGDPADDCSCTLRIYKSDQSTLITSVQVTTPGFSSHTLYPSPDTYFTDPIYIKITNDGDVDVHTYLLGAQGQIGNEPGSVDKPRALTYVASAGFDVKGAISVPWDLEESVETKMLLYGYQREVKIFDAMTGNVSTEFTVPERYDRVHVTTKDSSKVYLAANDTVDPKHTAIYSYDGTNLVDLATNVPTSQTGQGHCIVYSSANGLLYAPVVEGSTDFFKWSGTSWNKACDIEYDSNPVGSWYYGASEHYDDEYIYFVAPNHDELYMWDQVSGEANIISEDFDNPFFTFADLNTGMLNVLGDYWQTWDIAEEIMGVRAYAGASIDFHGGATDGEGRYGLCYLYFPYVVDSNGDIYQYKDSTISLEGCLFYSTQSTSRTPAAIVYLRNDEGEEGDLPIYLVTHGGSIYRREFSWSDFF